MLTLWANGHMTSGPIGPLYRTATGQGLVVYGG
jgi:hypothetical protein